MPKQSIVPIDMAVNALKKYIHHFTTNEFPRNSSQIWQDIAKDLKGLWQVSAVRLNIREDRRSILTLARQACGIFLPTPKKEVKLYDESYNDDSDTSCESIITDYDHDLRTVKNKVKINVEDDDGFSSFNVTITRKQWNKIKCRNPFDYKGRKYCGFVPGVWTNVIALAFWEQHHLKCAFVFKYGKIHKNGLYYAVLKGQCSDRNCRNPVLGLIHNHPGKNGPVTITMKCRDTRFINHADVKRPLNGQRRREVQEKLLRTGVAGWRKEEAEKILRPGDTKSPFLYNRNTLYNAKRQAEKENTVEPVMIDEENTIETDNTDFIHSLEKIAENVSSVDNILDQDDMAVILLVTA